MKRKMMLIGQLFRDNDFVTNILGGKIISKQPRGRPRQSYFNDINQRIGFTSYQQLKNMARNRRDWLLRQGFTFKN